MSDWLAPAIDFVRNTWPSKRAAFAASLAMAALVLLISQGIDFDEVSSFTWLVVGLLALVPWISWWLSVWIPRHPRGSVGFDIAISVEDPEHAAQLKADFIRGIVDRLAGRESRYPCDVIVHNKRISQSIIDPSTAIDLLSKSRGHFLVFGTARQRLVAGGQQHVLHLEGAVRHTAVEAMVAKQFKAEFGEVFPRRMLVGRENDVFTLDITAGLVDIATRYIVAIAAMISGDLEYAEELLKEVDQQLAGETTSIPQVASIKTKLPSRLADIYRGQLNRRIQIFIKSLDPSSLEEGELYLQPLFEYAPNDYSGRLFEAIAKFVLRRDVDGAHQALSNCRQIPDPTWRYSKAFLYAYSGDLQSAYQEYRHTFETDPADPSVPLQSEQFIQFIIDQEPERSQLFFCLGLINQRIKGDLAAARRDFGLFLSQTSSTEYPKQHDVVHKWVTEIDHSLRAEFR